jgi:hypothetical protein
MTYNFANDRFTTKGKTMTTAPQFEMTFTVTVEDIDGEITSHTFDTERRATNFANEEIRWERTQRVQCPDLQIDRLGDFAIIRKPSRPVARFMLDNHLVTVSKSEDGLTATCNTCSLSITAVNAAVFASENGIYKMTFDGAELKRL